MYPNDWNYYSTTFNRNIPPRMDLYFSIKFTTRYQILFVSKIFHGFFVISENTL